MSKIIATNIVFALTFQVFLVGMASVAMLTIFLLTDQTFAVETASRFTAMPFIP